MARTHYDLRDVRAICELTRAKGFREAAEALAITPSALSRRVAKLEEALGGLLVNRTTRSMSLTPLGRRLVSRCQPSLDALDDSIEELARVARGVEGQVAMGCIASASFALLAPVVARFRRQFPDLRINIKEADGPAIAAATVSHEVDFGLTTVPDRHKELQADLVAVDPFVFCCPPDHRHAGKKSLTWSQVAGERLMGYRASSSVRQMIDGQLARHGIELHWFDEVDTLSSLIGYMNTGSFTAVGPRLLAAQLPQMVAVPLKAPRLQRRLYLVRRKGEELTPPATALWEDVRRTVLASLR